MLPLSVVTQTKIPIEMPIKKIIPLAGKRLLGLHSAKLPNALPQFSSAADFVGYWRNFREISCGGECFPDFYSKLQQGIYDFNVLKELMETPSYMETLDGKLLKMLAPEFCSFFSARTLVDYCERKPLPQTPLLIEAVSSQRENPQTSAATQSAIPGWLGTFRYLTTQARATTTAAYQTLYGLFSNSQGRETFASQNSLSSRQNPIYNEVPKPSSATTEFFGSTSAAITPPKFVGHMTASDADSTAVAVNDPLPEVGGAQPIYPFELAFILAATLLTKPLHRLSSWLPSNQTRALSDEEKNRLQQQQKDLELIRKGFPENYTALKNSPYFPNDLLQDTDYLSRKTSHMITKMLRTNQTTSGDYELVTSYMDKLNARSNQLNTVLANDELTYDTQKRESGEYTMTLNTFLARNTSSFTANINRAHLTPTTDALLPIILPRLGNNP